MLQELVYTSAPCGLAPDTSGFCTVACTDGMATNLERVLVELSGYRHISAIGDAQEAASPVAFTHGLHRVGGVICHVVSRVGDAGTDYAGRANVIAHHLALDSDNLPQCGPAALLSIPSLFVTSWQGPPRLLPPREIASPDVTSQRCTVSAQVAEAVEAGRSVSLIFEPGMELLPIIAGALALLPPEKRWLVTFSTFFMKSQEPPGANKIQIKGILAGSEEMGAARSTPDTLYIDLQQRQPKPESQPKPAPQPESKPMSAPQTITTSSSSVRAAAAKIRGHILCPHCWHDFETDQVLFISASPDLLGDAKLGDTEQQRFLPMRFNVGGAALDSHGFPCHKIACPNCHLQLPRSLLHTKGFFISIAGAPSSGKSYFLAAMTYQLRQSMTRSFCLSFTDADAAMNERLRRDESRLFVDGGDTVRQVTIAKTEEQGDIYNQTLIDGKQTSLAQPFTFTLSPMPNHPMLDKFRQVGQTICLYDNAGESFLPGNDRTTQPVTRHLARSKAILFLFDPTQDLRFQRACQQPVNDPQMNATLGGKVRRSTVRQETVLNELATRVRAYLRLSPHQKHTAPLIVVLTKFDAWQQLVPQIPRDAAAWAQHKTVPLSIFNVQRVAEYSQALRTLFLELLPDLVSTAETFSSSVSYVAVSATGGPPSVDAKTGELGYSSGDIQPFWAEVPFLYAQHLTKKSCVPVLKEKS